MEKQIVSLKQQKQRKFLLVVPVLVLPFIVVIFWSLGGGQKAQAQQLPSETKRGLDNQLPDPQKQEDNGVDKLGFYQQADKDSANLRDQLRNDPYAKDTNAAANKEPTDTAALSAYAYKTVSGGISTFQNPDQQQINEKMAALYKQINEAQQSSANPAPTVPSHQLEQSSEAIRSMQGSTTPDPDMQQLSGMLDKILYIEHPEMAKEKIREQSLKNKKQVYTVSTIQEDETVQLMQTDSSKIRYQQYSVIQQGKRNKYRTRNLKYPAPASTAFYEYSNLAARNTTDGNAIQAEVAETRVLVSGSTIKLKLLNNIYVNGNLIPKDQFIYGTCTISGDRLLVSLNSVRYKNSIYPVSLAVYDVDGITGVYMPDAISRQVSKGSADQAVQGVNLYAFDNSLTGQAASAGVQAAKGLFSKKAELIKVTVKEGYQVFLKNTDENNN